MKTIFAVLMSLISMVYASEYPGYEKINFIEKKPELEVSSGTKISIIEYQVNGNTYIGYSSSYLTGFIRHGGDNYLKTEDFTGTDQPFKAEMTEIVRAEYGENFEIRLIHNHVRENQIITVSGEIENCKVRRSGGAVGSSVFDKKCVGDYAFSSQKINQYEVGTEVEVSFLEKLNNAPCSLFTSIRHPFQCSKELGGEVLSIKELR